MQTERSVKDKFIERLRYDERATELLHVMGSLDYNLSNFNDVQTIPLTLRSPYCKYEEILISQIKNDQLVLEIGSGIGNNTSILLNTGARIHALDISEKSLNTLKARFKSFKNLTSYVADIECLPFKDRVFDIVASAGCLSYGDNVIVLNEIYRVLKLGGSFICVDSLDHNPVYRINRIFHYLRGNRSLSTLISMPKISTLRAYRDAFGEAEIQYFGGISWLMPMFSFLIGSRRAAQFSDYWDRIFNIRRSAFKFVMVARKIK